MGPRSHVIHFMVRGGKLVISSRMFESDAGPTSPGRRSGERAEMIETFAGCTRRCFDCWARPNATIMGLQ